MGEMNHVVLGAVRTRLWRTALLGLLALSLAGRAELVTYRATGGFTGVANMKLEEPLPEKEKEEAAEEPLPEKEPVEEKEKEEA